MSLQRHNGAVSLNQVVFMVTKTPFIPLVPVLKARELN